MRKELTSQSAKELIEKLKKRYSISQPQVYKRLRYLSIQSTKQNGEVWLISEQLEALDGLNQHLVEGGKLEEYNPHWNGIVKAEPAEIQSHATPVETIPVETVSARQTANNSEATENLHETAQAKATGRMILENLLIQKYLDNPELLPPEMKEAVAKSEALATPKSVDPLKYAQEAFRLMSTST